jgi:biopolymer transport protein TolR
MAGGMLNGGRKGRGRYRPMSEINVTPMVDVMLVLLIIFMVTAPLLTNSVNVDLPKVGASQTQQDNEPLTVSVDAEGKVFLQNEEIGLPELVAKLTAISQDQKDRRVLVRGDKANTYGKMLEVMGTIITGGFTKVSLLTNPSGAVPAAAAPAATPPTRAPAPAASPARQGRG